MLTFLKKSLPFILSLLVFLLFCEIGFRTYLTISSKVSFLTNNDIMYYHYPELRKIKDYTYQPDKINLLVLGGSVLYDEPIEFIDRNNEPVVARFCQVGKILAGQSEAFNVVSLAVPAHTTLDSRYKYEYLAKEHFDYVFIYHGINDTRSNNIYTEGFDSLYRHIEFYDDVAIFFRHRDDILVTPLFLDWLWHKTKNILSSRDYIPREFLAFIYEDFTEVYDTFMSQGADIKTNTTFERNLLKMLKISKQRNEQLILSTYSFYYDPAYTYEKFMKGQLAYTDSLFPIELYGYPENVVKGIRAHNAIIQDIADKHPDILLIDAENTIPKDEQYFNDICHLTPKGCYSLVSLLKNKISDSRQAISRE